jgi:cytochrome b
MSAESATGALTHSRTRVWDVPTRLVHWTIAALVPFSWWSAHSDHLRWHRLSGYAILGLLVFRLIWGVAGSSTARFAGFLRGPAALLAYLRGRGGPLIGHNPLGGWSVVAMLLALAVQVALGLFSIDEDGFEAGPLSKFIGFDASRAVARVHHLSFYVLLALIVLHLGAVAFHGFRGRNLTGPMITGRARLTPGAPAPRLAPPWRIAAAALIAAALAWFVAHGLRL